MSVGLEPSVDESPLPVLGDVLEFVRVMWEVDHALERASKRMEASVGVTALQRFVIQIVGRFPGIPAGHLAELLHLHPSTVSGVLKRLQKAGLIRRRSDPRDGRRSLLGLSDKGRQLALQTDGTVGAAIERALKRLPPEKLRVARDVLTAIVTSVNDTEAESSGAAANFPP